MERQTDRQTETKTKTYQSQQAGVDGYYSPKINKIRMVY